jgi:hypothetical protein
MATRERRLIEDGSPCDTNYFDQNLLTVRQAQERGPQPCQNYAQCRGNSVYCTLNHGMAVAKYVVKGGTLQGELSDYIGEADLHEEFLHSVNGRDFEKIKGKGKIVRAVEYFARVVLGMDPFESIFPKCEKCDGIRLTKEVIDSIHDGPFPLSGSGRTRRRSAEYCPDCDPEPRNGIIKEDPADVEERAFLKRMAESQSRR